MNEQIAKIYDQALVLESNGDYVAGELDPVKFAELIIREYSYDCMDVTSSPEHIQFVARKWGVEL